MPDSKVCTLCGVDKSLDEFTPQRTGKYGRLAYCRPCNAEYVRLRSQDPERKARVAQKQRERRSDPAKAQADRETSARWKRDNPERAKAHNSTPEKIASNSAWNERNRDKRIAYVRKYQAKNPEIVKVAQQRRRARLRKTRSRLTHAEWLAILSDFNLRCAYCLRADLPLQQEHMQPLSRGGSHAVGNVIPSCGPCNYRKHTRDLLQFLMIGARHG